MHSKMTSIYQSDGNKINCYGFATGRAATGAVMRSTACLVFCLALLAPLKGYAEWISNVSSKEIYEHQRPQVTFFVDDKADIREVNRFFAKHFYHMDRYHFEEHIDNRLELSPEFMDSYLRQSYALRQDSWIQPVKGKEVDAIMHGIAPGTVMTHLMALKRSMDLGWKFRQVHLFTSSDEKLEDFDRLVDKVFPGPEERPNIHYVVTHQKDYVIQRGLRLLIRHEQIAPYYMVIESSDLFATKVEAICRETLGFHATCLGTNLFQIKDWRAEAKIHGYPQLYSDDQQMRTAWFYAHMNYLARKIHYEFLHGLDLEEEELVAVRKLANSRDLDKAQEAEIFRHLSSSYYEKSLCETGQDMHYAIQLIRALCLIHYVENLPFSVDKHFYERITFAAVQKHLIDSQAAESLLDTKRYQQRLTALRQEAKRRIAEGDCDVHALAADINFERDLIITSLIRDAMDLVGPPPCRFAVLIFGSGGRNEATPYSDLEFGLILEEDTPEAHQYFETLTAVLMLKVTNLSETITYTANIPCFNTKHPPEYRCQWFTDLVVPRGVSCDPLDAPGISKLPLMTEGKESAFLGTPKQIVEKRRHSMETYGYSNLTMRFLYGDKQLFLDLQNEQAPYLRSQLRLMALRSLKDLMQDYHRVVPHWSGKPVWFKQTFARPLTAALECLGDIYHLEACSSVGRIQELRRRGILTQAEASLMEEYATLVQRRRLAVHLERGRQSEGVDKESCPELDTLLHLKRSSQLILQRLLDLGGQA